MSTYVDVFSAPCHVDIADALYAFFSCSGRSPRLILLERPLADPDLLDLSYPAHTGALADDPRLVLANTSEGAWYAFRNS